MRRVRAAILTLTALMVLAAIAVPACAEVCCKRAETPTVHAQMPCCEPSMAQRDTRVQPATAATLLPTLQKQVAVTVTVAPRLAPLRPHVHAVAFAAASAPPATPPLFLLNDQFLI